jgi:hypothetical protein
MKNIASQEGQYTAITGPYNKRKADHKFCGSLMQHLPYMQNIRRLVWPNYCVNNWKEHQKTFFRRILVVIHILKKVCICKYMVTFYKSDIWNFMLGMAKELACHNNFMFQWLHRERQLALNEWKIIDLLYIKPHTTGFRVFNLKALTPN